MQEPRKGVGAEGAQLQLCLSSGFPWHWDTFPVELGLGDGAGVGSQCHFGVWKVLFAPLAGVGSS